MNHESQYDIRIPSIAECEDFLTQPIALLTEEGNRHCYSEEYHTFLREKIWDDCHYSIDDMVSGKDIHHSSQLAPCAFTSLRKKVYECLNHNESLVIQLVEDCGHRLDRLEAETEKHIAADTLTGSEYIKIKRSSNVIRVIYLMIHSRLEGKEDPGNRDSINHPLKSRTKSNLKKIMRMSSRVDKHLDSMLESAKRENLRAETSVWFVAATIIFFVILYMQSDFAPAEQVSATSEAARFFGLK